jgi:hypothetical protein
MFRLTRLVCTAVRTILLIAFAVSFLVAEDGLEPFGATTHPTDKGKSAAFKATTGKFSYTIEQGGTMDGENCRTPMSVAMEGPKSIPMEKTWESNRAVRMENIGVTDVKNPWISNGRNNYRSAKEIVAIATENCKTFREKALGIFWAKQVLRYHWGAGEGYELLDPVKVFNIYGCHTCGCDPLILGYLWKLAGINKSMSTHFSGHAEGQAYFDGRYNMLDGDQNEYVLLRDNETIANEEEMTRDHDLVKRTHASGILAHDNRLHDEGYAAFFVYSGPPEGDRGYNSFPTTMNMTLRPGEALTWRWGHLNPPKYLSNSLPPASVLLCNGLWEYKPDFQNDKVWRSGTSTQTNIANNDGVLSGKDGQTGVIIWKIASPYVFIGGHIEAEGSGYSFKSGWTESMWEPVEGANLDSKFPPAGPARFSYFLKCELPQGASLKNVKIVNDIQMHSLNLPAMVVGTNTFTYTDDNTDERKVSITHEWVERSASKPPVMAEVPLYPVDNGVSDGTEIVFKWSPATDPDGDKIADYQFELFDRADLKYPMSADFYKLISRTADKGKAQYTLPYPGMLTPGKKYYWHVRAKDSKGVWSKFSKAWSFTAKGPAYPIEVTMEVDKKSKVGTLKWKRNPVGNPPAKYRVYGSDEKGFSVSDKDYSVNIGSTAELKTPFPANFVAETTKTELAVVGPDIGLPNANKAYYRVVAVDANGKWSWSSDYAEAPRPFIFTKPITTATNSYTYNAASIRSIGDLQIRDNQVTKFYDIEKLRYSLKEAPSWLKIDEDTGVLSGTPSGSKPSGKVVIAVVIVRNVPQVDVQKLGWGNYTTQSTKTVTSDEALQEFEITGK